MIENSENYQLLATIFIVIMVVAFSYGIIHKLMELFSKKNSDVNSENDSLLLSIVRPISYLIEDNPKYRDEIIKYQKLLDVAGTFWGGFTAVDVVAAKFVLPIVGIVWGLLFCLILNANILIAILAAVFGGLICAKAPESSLLGQVEKQKEQFALQFPSAVDFLLISIQSGLSLRQAVSYLSKNYIDGAVKSAFSKLDNELSIGLSFNEGLLNLANRYQITEVTTLMISIAQAIETGSSVADILRFTAADMRKNRLFEAKSDAQKATVKIAFPMLLLIIPGIFIVLLGPVFIKILSTAF